MFISDYATTINEYNAWLKADDRFKFSKPSLRTLRNAEPGGERDYEIYQLVPKDKEFKLLNNQMQQLFVFFIDGASFIDVDDHWKYQILVCKNPRAIVGFATTYQLELNNGSTATRISQFLILPPFQKRGLGKVLLEAIYEVAMKDKLCSEITVEDPSDDFQNMRDSFDIRLILSKGYFKAFKKREPITKDNFCDFTLSKSEVKEICKILKLTKSRV